MNKVILHGRIGTDPETKTFDDGGRIANFSFATDESYKNKEGQKVEKTEWHSIQVNGKLVDVAEKFFRKGTELLIDGKIRTRSWEKDGNKFYKTEVEMRGFDFCGSKSSAEDKPQPQDYKQPVAIEDEDSDGLPF